MTPAKSGRPGMGAGEVFFEMAEKKQELASCDTLTPRWAPKWKSWLTTRMGAVAMMNLGPCIMVREISGFSKRSVVYLQRQVAKTVITAALVAVSASLAYADAFKIEATFTGGVHGIGSFTTDGTCLVCTEVSGLSHFTFSVLDASFDDVEALTGNFTFTRQTLFVQSLFMKDSLTGDSINFTPIQPGPGTFSSVWIDSGLPKFSNSGTITPVPEPSSSILLFTLLAIASKWRRRSLRHDG